MQADVVARQNLGGSIQGLSGDGVDKRSHVRADGTVRRHLVSVVDDEPENPRVVPTSGCGTGRRTNGCAGAMFASKIRPNGQ